MIHAHSSYQPTNDTLHFFGNYYISNSFPDVNNHKIRYISPLPYAKLANIWSRGSIQSQTFGVEFDGPFISPDLPMYKHGLRGEGEIVTVIDSGVDTNLCYFKDENVRVPINVTNLEHRKIVRYDAWGDETDVNFGHGTHVTGIVAGKALCANCSGALYNGNAPESKVYFVDAGVPAHPQDLTAEYDFEMVLNNSRDMGSRIYSCSWGFDNYEDAFRNLYDQVFVAYPDISFLYAAGNEHRMFSTYIPAECKNAIAIGSTNIPNIQGVFSQSSPDIFAVEVVETGEKIHLSNTAKLKDIIFKADEIPDFHNMKGIAFDDATCDDVNSLAAPFVIFPQSKYTNCAKPIFTVDDDKFSLIKDKTLSLASDFIAEQTPSYTVSSFSSGGPSSLGLVKPDIVAPGAGVMSACASRTKCIASQVISKSGTSMSTPAVAGGTAIMMQYFREGFYPSGAKSSNSLPLWSHAVRALLITAAGPIKDGNRMPQASSGFGSMHLGNVMPFADEDRVKFWGLRIMPNETIHSHETKKATLKLTSEATELVITLSWLDPPLDEQSLIPTYADLDLILISPSGDVVYGNQKPNDQEEDHSTNERIVLSSPEPGEYTVYVTCPELPLDTTILFAVAATGPFPHIDLDTNPEYIQFDTTSTCPGGCKNGGKCSSGRCSCQPGFTGLRCQHMMETLQDGELTMQSRVTRYFTANMSVLTSTDDYRITIAPGSPRNRCLQIELSLGAPTKFGGQFLEFAKLNKSSHTFILHEYYPDLVLTLFEGTSNTHSLTITTQTGTRNESTEYVSSTPRPHISLTSDEETQSEVTRPGQINTYTITTILPIIAVSAFVVGIVVFAGVFYFIRKRRNVEALQADDHHNPDDTERIDELLL